jgi:AcrR family transcriptional regulator
MERKTDPRVIRTRQMLRDALITLILERGYDAISIQDITDKAGLRRATFYLHYRDKDELLFNILRDSFDHLVTDMESISGHSRTDYGVMYVEYKVNLVIFQHVQENAALYRSIFNGHGAATITNFILTYLIERTKKDLLEYDCEFHVPMDVYVAYSSTTKLNMAIWWLNAGMPYSPEDMAEICSRLALQGTQVAYTIRARLNTTAK